MLVQDASVVRNPFVPDVDPASDIVATLADAWEKGSSLVMNYPLYLVWSYLLEHGEVTREEIYNLEGIDTDKLPINYLF